MIKDLFSVRNMIVTSMACSMTVWGNAPLKGKAHAHGFKDAKIEGQIEFSQKDSAVALSGEIHGLTPNGIYAMHVHTFGDCTDPDAPGPHFDPMETKKHGNPEGHEMHHAGDLPNITADKNGVGKIEFQSKSFSLSGYAAIVGRSVVIHEKADDYTSQPAGASGARIACGVIGMAKPEAVIAKVDSSISKIVPAKK
jgi:superoxide dismutase, Cu-Zn family